MIPDILLLFSTLRKRFYQYCDCFDEAGRKILIYDKKCAKLSIFKEPKNHKNTRRSCPPALSGEGLGVGFYCARIWAMRNKSLFRGLNLAIASSKGV